MLKIFKRFQGPAYEAHTLLRELLVYALGWVDVVSDPGTGSFGLLQDGLDGETDSSTPTLFTAASGSFNGSLVGKYLVLGTGASFASRGVYRIVSVVSTTSLVVASGPYGASFTTALNVAWRVVDPTQNTGTASSFCVRGPAGTATPAWEVLFLSDSSVPDEISYEVGPSGGYTPGFWTQPVLTSQTVTADTPSIWYFHVQDTGVTVFTESSGGSRFALGYAGTGSPRAPAVDDHFAIALGGLGNDGLEAIAGLAADGSTVVDYEALVFIDNGVNVFGGSMNPVSGFDLKRDVGEIAMGCSIVGFQEIDRGTFRDLVFVPSVIGYRSFIDSGRQWLGLGSGIALRWDGSLVT